MAGNDFGREVRGYEDDVLLALSFSGGGTRAAAFSFGVLTELDRSRAGSDQAKSLLDRVDFVSGVSGGSVTAAYFGLKKRAALDDFRERFLLRNAEEGLNTQVSLGNIGRALGGGVNDSQFTSWLDRNLFDGARFDAFREDRRPRVWINASDIYNRTPFVFGKTAFDALCSDISTYRVAEAVAASAAVPLAFAPIVLETFPGGCATQLPAWIERARRDPNAQPLLRSFAEAIARYHDGSMRFVKLLDGGLVDNFGLSGFSIALLAAQRPFEPMTERQAVKVRRMMFLVVDAGRGISGDFAQRIEGPQRRRTGHRPRPIPPSMPACDRATRRSRHWLNDWTGSLKRWRCGLSAAERTRLGVGTELALRRPQLLHRPGEFRATRAGARGVLERGTDAVHAAGGAGRSPDRRRRRRAAPEQDLSGISPRALNVGIPVSSEAPRLTVIGPVSIAKLRIASRRVVFRRSGSG